MFGSFGMPSRRRTFVFAAAVLLAAVASCLVALGGSSGGPQGATAQTTTTATTTFLKITDKSGNMISGGSGDAAHKDQIPVRSWAFGVENSATFSATSGAATGKASARPLTFRHGPNPSWPRLFEASAQATQLAQAVLSVSRTGENPARDYLTYTLQPVFVTKVEDSSSGGAPAQEVTLVYGSATVSYKHQRPDGSLADPITLGWDYVANQPTK